MRGCQKLSLEVSMGFRTRFSLRHLCLLFSLLPSYLAISRPASSRPGFSDFIRESTSYFSPAATLARSAEPRFVLFSAVTSSLNRLVRLAGWARISGVARRASVVRGLCSPTRLKLSYPEIVPHLYANARKQPPPLSHEPPAHARLGTFPGLLVT